MQKTVVWMLLATAMLTTSCGGDQSGGSTAPVVTAPTPAPSPTPTPTPTATPTPVVAASLTFPSVSVAAVLDADGVAKAYPAVAGTEAGAVVVSDPDAPAATSFEDLRFSGNETINVSLNEAGPSYSGSFAASSGKGSESFDFYAAGAGQSARSVSLFDWKNAGSGSAAAELELVQTQVESAPVANPPASYLAAHARLIEAVFSDREGIEIFGNPTPASSWPKASGLEYDGEVYGTVFTSGKNKLPFLGNATLYVDGSKSDNQIHGIIHISQYEGQGNTGLPITIDVVADETNGTIVSHALTVEGAGGTTSYGSVTGAFYGAKGDELGLVFSASGGVGVTIGGLIVRLK